AGKENQMPNFDSYYDPPSDREPSPQSEAICALLEDAGVDQSIIDQVVEAFDKLEAEASRECAECERRARQAEIEADRQAEAYLASLPLPEVAICPHGTVSHTCNSCMIAGDLAYDAARERRMR